MIRPSADDCKLIASLGVSQALLGQVIFLPGELKVHPFDGLSRLGIYWLQSQDIIGLGQWLKTNRERSFRLSHSDRFCELEVPLGSDIQQEGTGSHVGIEYP